jgi:pyrrolidone-carboxylate peptidase
VNIVQRPTSDALTKVIGSHLMRYGFISLYELIGKLLMHTNLHVQPISKESNDIKKCLNSRLPLSKLCSKLRTLGYAVSTSNDPGRFVCNYTYYHSLSSCVRESENSIFIHCPPFEVVPEARQLAFMRSFMLVAASELCA